jgi:hypothetical protein
MTNTETRYAFTHTTSMVRDSVQALDGTILSEEVRTALFKPLDEDALRSQAKNLVEIVSYNMLFQSHLEVFQNTQANPNRFSDVTPLGFNMLYTMFGAVGHMNGVNATATTVGAAKHPMHVRTLFEPINERQPNGEMHSLGVRIWHLNYAVPRAQHGIRSTESARAVDADEDGDDDNEADEASEAGHEADEEFIKRRDKKLLDKAANVKAKTEMRQQLTLTFGGAFTQMVNDAVAYRDGKTTVSTNVARRETYSRLTNDLKDGIHWMMVNEDSFLLASAEAQFEKVTRMHLRSHKRLDTWDTEDVRLDPRPFAVPGAIYNRDTMGPTHALDAITAMTYYTDPICDEQRDLTRYFGMSDSAINAVLVGDPSFEQDAAARRDALLADENMDTGDLMNMTMEDARRYTKNTTGTNMERVRHLFTRDPARITYMQRANLKPSDFRGFPFPEHVYELSMEYCRAEVIFQIPLPVPLFVPLTGLRSMGPISSVAHRDNLLNMIRVQQLLRDNREGRMTTLITKTAADLLLTQRMTEYTLALKARVASTFQSSRTYIQGASVMPGGSLTPEGVLRLMRMLNEQSKLLGFHALSDMAATCVSREVERLAMDAIQLGHLKFKETFIKAYHKMIESFGMHVEHKANDDLAHMMQVDEATSVGDHQVAAATEASRVRLPMRPAESDGEMLSNLERAKARFVQTAVENVERLQNVDPAVAEMLQTADALRGVSTYLGNVPAEIIELDDALQEYRKNSTTYARLALEFTNSESCADSVSLFETRLWESISDAASNAHETLFNSENIDPVTKGAAKWFKNLPPDQTEVEFRMLYDVRPNMNMRIYVNESLASPAINASQNATALNLTYYGSLHHCRWYIHSNDPKTNILLAGDGTSGKSFILNVVDYLSPPGVATTLTYMSNHAMHVKANNDGYLTIFHEAMHRLLHPNTSGKDGSAGESGDAANFLKDRLTRGRCSVLVLHHDPKTKERSQLFFETSAQGMYIMATNDSTKGADDNVLSRFIVFSVPKPRDQAEGSNPTERVVDLAMEGQRYVAAHYSERVAHQHRLLRFRYMYMEFMNKAGVIPDGFQTYGGRILIDNILNEMHETYSIDTRDPRKRKITEEMARSMAGLYAVFMGLGSPLAKWYANLPEVNGNLWTSDAFLAITAPFMFVAKDHVIDALSLLESIWAPQYQTRILFTIAFGVAQLHHMTNSSFRVITKSANKELGGGGGGGGGGGMSYSTRHTMSEVDYRYVAVEDAESDQHINQRIAEHCSKYGIRSADVDAYLFRCSKQWMPMRRIELADALPGRIGDNNTPYSPEVIGAVRKPSSMARSLENRMSDVAHNDDYSMEDSSVEADALYARSRAEVNKRIGVPSTLDDPLHGERINLRFTEDISIREQVVRREYVNADNHAKGGRRLCISVEFLMRHLPFDVTKLDTMAALVAADKSHPRKHFEAVKIGPRSDINFAQRIIAARAMATLDGDMSPIMTCVKKVLSNAYLEVVPRIDTEAAEYMNRITREHTAAIQRNKDPAKKMTLPWMSYVTSHAVHDYTLESKDTQRHPEGRTISFYDTLKMLPLKRDPSNLRPIMRHNYARLSIFGKEMLAFDQLGAQRSGNVEDTRIIGALDRSRVMNQAMKVGYTADIDYYEASYRMKSMAHPGLKGINMDRLIAFPPVTYNVIKTITEELYKVGAYRRESRALMVEYPEDDPNLPLEYPTHLIVKRIREFEIIDRNEANDNYSHVTPMDDIYMLNSTVGPLNFRHLHEEYTQRRDALQSDIPAEIALEFMHGKNASDVRTNGAMSDDAKRYLRMLAPKKQVKRSMFKTPSPSIRGTPGGSFKRPNTDDIEHENNTTTTTTTTTTNNNNRETQTPARRKTKKARTTVPIPSDSSIPDTDPIAVDLLYALLGGIQGPTATSALPRNAEIEMPVEDEMMDFM